MRKTFLLVIISLFFAVLRAGASESVQKSVSARQPWTETAALLAVGDTFRIQAAGTIVNTKLLSRERFKRIRFDLQNGPEGTYFVAKDHAERSSVRGPEKAVFPLPAVEQGRWPAYGLIGKIGEEGAVFFVGKDFTGRAESAGELFLGINDYDFSDNDGAFDVSIETNVPEIQNSVPPEISEGEPAGAPVPNAMVILIYVDGLKPDTVDEMISFGHLPNIKEIFYDRGIRLKHCFTVYESNTVVANSVFMTGRWPDATGIKNQAFFERFETTSRPFFKRLFRKEKYPRTYNLLSDLNVAPRLLKEHKVRAFYDYLGERYLSTISPINPATAPMAWPHTAVNEVENPFFVTTEAKDQIDQINGEYALHLMLNNPHGRLLLIWLPGLDDDGHITSYGQLGGARRNMALTDRLIGELGKSLEGQKKRPRTYMILFSDHGNMGGDNGTYNQPFHIGVDFLFDILKMNVRNAHYTRIHPGTNPDHFVYLDSMGRGQAKIYLPVGGSVSGDWTRPNTLYELQHYGLGPNRESVDLISSLASLNLSARNVFPEKTSPYPVDLVMTKVKKDLIYVRKHDGSEALIWAKREAGKDYFRYLPVRGVIEDQSGNLNYEEADIDPFGYLVHPAFHAGGDRNGFLNQYHDLDEWLEATFETDYPDAVVALWKVFGWSDALSHLTKARDPDMMLSANKGWNFFHEPIQGTDHGYLKAPSMRIPMMISGPNIKHGVISKPYRLINLTPTVFHMIRYEGKTDFDAAGIEGIYRA